MTTTTTPVGSTDAHTTDWEARVDAVASRLAATAAAHDRSGELSLDAIDLCRAAGLTTALVPAEVGGGGATHAEMGAILRRLGRRDPSTAVTLAMHSHLLAAQVWRHRHGQDASTLFQRVLDGAILVSTGASDWVGSNGTARRVDGGYVVSARKAPASGCEAGTILVTSIRWDDAPDGPQVIHGAIPFSAEGVRIEKTWDTLGLRATGSHTVVLEDVLLPDSAVSLVRPADRWHPVWNAVIGAAMPLIMAAYVGIADAAVELAMDLVADREGAHLVPLVGELHTTHLAAVDAVDAMLRSSEDLRFEATDAHASRTLARKSVATDALLRTVRLAVEVAGGVGYSRTSDLERLFRDVHGALFHPLPHASQLVFTGREALGLPLPG